jgi:hypothetical protein
VGVGCGVGVGFGGPLNLAGVPVLGSATAGVSAGLSALRGSLGGVERALRRLLPPLPAVPGLAAGAGCGVGVGYGYGAGLFLKPEALLQLHDRARALQESLLAAFPRPHAPSEPAADAPALVAAQLRLLERVDSLTDSVAALRREQAALREEVAALSERKA